MGIRERAVESVVNDAALRAAFAGKRVFVTGHTGFKGAWLCEWLLALGAEVRGFSLPPPTAPALFVQLGLEARLDHVPGDVRDLGALRASLHGWDPDFVFHLAAQPLVRLSYSEPAPTFATNFMGTVHLLEAVRSLRGGKRVAVVCVTTDKCYENREWLHSYRENDPMGGHDPYSASKGAAELAIASYRKSFFPSDGRISLASARAGNVIGGGDWALDRIVPDCMRDLQSGRPIRVRNPRATRPWQHVLEPLGGYLALAAALYRESSASALQSGFNFGPPLASNRSVRDVVEEILLHWEGRWEDASDPSAVHEATLLNLATDKAYHLLGWEPRWSFAESVRETVVWYRAVFGEGADAREWTVRQIKAYGGVAA